MPLQQVERILWKDLKDYHFDNIEIEIPLENIEELQNEFTINGKKLKEFLEIKGKYITIQSNKLILTLKNFFGEVSFYYKNDHKKTKIVPLKIFPPDINPKKGYDFIRNKVFLDIGNFLSFIVKEIKDFQTLESLKIMIEDFINSPEYIIILLEKSVSSCKELLEKLFISGPIHKEILVQKTFFGTKISFSSKNIIDPYKFYYKQSHTLDTLLNQMLFQTLYFIVQECNCLKHTIKIESERRNEVIRKIDEILMKANFLLEKYQLWCFFSDKPINFVELMNKINNQPNLYYKKIFDIYKEVVKVTFSRTILENILEGIEFPISKFESIYELWTVSLFYNTLRNIYKVDGKPKLESYEKRSTKLKIMFSRKGPKKVYLIWEIKFSPILDSLYFESLFEDREYETTFEIKPDLLIVLENKKTKKIFLGDVKFSKDEKIELPTLRDLYKVLSYLSDLSNKSKILKNKNVEGILIYPGLIKYIRVPKIQRTKKGKKVYYINIMPLNYESTDLSYVFKK